MSVSLTVSETIDGTQIADVLSPTVSGNTGTNLGQVTNGSYAPLVNQTANTGRQDWFIRGDNTVDPITDVKVHLQEYGTGTLYNYGGPGSRSPAADLATIIAEGNASGSNKSNNDGLSSGIWMEMNAAQLVTETNQFDQGTRSDEVIIFGDSGSTVGVDLANAVPIIAKACVIDSDQSLGGDATNGFIPTAPQDGQIGVDGDTALGDNMHIALRSYLRSAFATGGVFQVEIAVVYTFTS